MRGRKHERLLFLPLQRECILCPVRGRKQYSEVAAIHAVIMHLMPREGTETTIKVLLGRERRMHLMPREGTETTVLKNFQEVQNNASYAP